MKRLAWPLAAPWKDKLAAAAAKKDKLQLN